MLLQAFGLAKEVNGTIHCMPIEASLGRIVPDSDSLDFVGHNGSGDHDDPYCVLPEEGGGTYLPHAMSNGLNGTAAPVPDHRALVRANPRRGKGEAMWLYRIMYRLFESLCRCYRHLSSKENSSLVSLLIFRDC
jgi:hypothetical protein